MRIFFPQRIYAFCIIVTVTMAIDNTNGVLHNRNGVFTARHETESLNVIHVSRNL